MGMWERNFSPRMFCEAVHMQPSAPASKAGGALLGRRVPPTSFELPLVIQGKCITIGNNLITGCLFVLQLKSTPCKSGV